MDGAARPGSPAAVDAPAGERYLLLADISGYTGFMTGVELEHGVDFGAGIPAAYAVLGDLLSAVIEGLAPDFAVVKLEGDAVFAAAPRRQASTAGATASSTRCGRRTGRSSGAAPGPSHRATTSVRPVPPSRTSISRSWSTAATRCARRSGPAATCSARP